MIKHISKMVGMAALAAVILTACKPTVPKTDTDRFAQCLKDRGAVFYGAYWCPHCQDQKKAFGSSEAFLPYVECATPNGQGQTDECRQKGIQAYPTWIFADGTQQSGNLSFDALAQRTGCPVPSATTPSS